MSTSPCGDESEAPIVRGMSDLFDELPSAPKPTPKGLGAKPAAKPAAKATTTGEGYDASHIEVLEGLEPVRRRPGMYIGGTDERALHHLVAEILDNAMDEAVAGHADRIELEIGADGSVAIRDNGRGIPVDPHPKFPDKSALEVILTTLHSGGKFSGKSYATSGGLHGVGLSVVNALADQLDVEVARGGELFTQSYQRGAPMGAITAQGAVRNRRGTMVRFRPDPTIFGTEARFKPSRLFAMARSKAYLYKGVEIRWTCAEALVEETDKVPSEARFRFPGGLADYLAETLGDKALHGGVPFTGEATFPDEQGRIEWAIAWPADDQGFAQSYCNTIPTPQGGMHENGLRTATARAFRGFGELLGLRKAKDVTVDDILADSAFVLSVFIREPQFQGQTKERLTSPDAARLVDQVIKDRLDHWLSADPAMGRVLLDRFIEKAEERARRKQDREQARKSATRRLRLPGKLADCSRGSADGTEMFIVEGDSAGGSAKQARNRETQAILPLRGKILNVASATADKLRGNQELSDLALALGCGTGASFELARLRYERIIIMTDADVDGAHIAALLMTFFYREMPGLISSGRLFLAMPPLYRLSVGNQSVYARDDAEKDALMAGRFKNRNVDISRFKGLGEMPPAQLKATTMAPDQRTLLRVVLPDAHNPDQAGDAKDTARLVEELMGRRPEARFSYIQKNARFVEELDV